MVRSIERLKTKHYTHAIREAFRSVSREVALGAVISWSGVINMTLCAFNMSTHAYEAVANGLLGTMSIGIGNTFLHNARKSYNAHLDRTRKRESLDT